MLKMTLSEIAEAVGGTLCSAEPDTEIGAIDLDSRSITAGSLFIPIVGERFDAHDYIAAALDSGAAAALTAREPLEGRPCILVDDTRLALKRLAVHYRNKFSIPFIAVTGSVGKTTAKDMLACVLSQKLRVLKTAQNLNNDIGLPQMIFKLTPEHDAAVLEMGMNHFGEIRYLAEIVRPNIVVMTNIGDAHIENMGSRENTFKAKCEVLEYLAPGGTVIVNGDDPLLRRLRLEHDLSVVLCGEAEDCDLRADKVDTGSGESVSMELVLPGGRERIDIPAAGRHMIYPALFAAAAGLGMGLSVRQVREGVAAFAPSKMRMNVKKLRDGIVVLDDAYNANPQSMAAAVEILASREAKKRIAVLGDMLELGEFSDRAHTEIGEKCRALGIDLVLTLGEAGKKLALAAGGRHCASKLELAAVLAENMQPETTVLIKASRGMHFEEITEFMEEHYK